MVIRHFHFYSISKFKHASLWRLHSLSIWLFQHWTLYQISISKHFTIFNPAKCLNGFKSVHRRNSKWFSKLFRPIFLEHFNPNLFPNPLKLAELCVSLEICWNHYLVFYLRSEKIWNEETEQHNGIRCLCMETQLICIHREIA